MRIITLKDIEEFKAALASFQASSAEAQRLALETVATIQHNAAIGNEDAALALGMAAMEKLQGQLNDHIGKLVEMIEYIYGEKPGRGEAPLEFVGRIVSWSDKNLAAAQRRHGIVLKKEPR